MYYSIDQAISFICNYLDINESEYDLQNQQKSKEFVNDVNNALICYYNEEWYSKLNNDEREGSSKNKLRFYRQVKKDNEFEKYLKIVNNPNVRASLTKFRLSAHDLRIEKDRINTAMAFAKKTKTHLVLKGAPTVTAVPDGRAFINSSGNPGMATAGAGNLFDVT